MRPRRRSTAPRAMRPSTTSSSAMPSNSRKSLRRLVSQRPCCGVPTVRRRGGGGKPGRVLRQRHHCPSRLQVAEQCQHRQQHRDRQQRRAQLFEPRLQPQPEGDAQAAVQPSDDQQRQLDPAKRRRRNPEGIQFLRVALIQSELGERDARHRKMVRQQRRYRETQQELRQFGRRPVQATALGTGRTAPGRNAPSAPCTARWCRSSPAR